MTVKQSTQSLTHVLIGFLSLIINYFMELHILGFGKVSKSEQFSDGRVCLQWKRHKVLAMNSLVQGRDLFKFGYKAEDPSCTQLL